MSATVIQCKACGKKVQQEGFCKECAKLTYYEKTQLSNLMSIHRTLKDLKREMHETFGAIKGSADLEKMASRKQ